MTWKFSRSHQECWRSCPQKYWLTYHDNGKGWQRRVIPWDLLIGGMTHDIIAYAVAASPGRIPSSEIIQVALNIVFPLYQADIERLGGDLISDAKVIVGWERAKYLAAGMAMGWMTVRLPYILDTYEVVSTEEEWNIPLTDEIVLMTRLDHFLKRKVDGALKVLELKTTGLLTEDYVEGWGYSTQVLAAMVASTRKLGDQVTGVQMEFLYKGRKYKGKDGQSTDTSPFLRAYQHVSGEWSFDSDVSKKKGWGGVSAMESGLTIPEWYAMIPPEILVSQFRTSDIYRKEREEGIWLEETIREQSWLERLVELGQNEFPKWLSSDCFSNRYRQKCPFLEVCWGEVYDIEGSGLYVERVSHHPQEWEEESA